MLILALALGCTHPVYGDGKTRTDRPTDDTGEDSAYLDLTKEFPPAPDGGIEIRTPVFEVPPYTELLKCYYGTYYGPTVGVRFMQPLQADQFSHHNQLKTVPDDEEWPDETLIDCEEAADMSVYVPLFEAVGIEASPDTADGNWLNLPEGVAMRLKGGQKWVLDIHYINTTEKTLLVNNGVNLAYIDEDEVESWASSIQFDAGPPDIPPGEEVSTTFQCEFPHEGHLLSMLGHMHARGTRYRVDHIGTDGARENVYDLEWDGGYHPYYPHIETYAPGAFPVGPGEALETTCDWYNYTDTHLGFPEEMCTTVLVMYPLDHPLICIDGEYRID